MTVQKDPEGLEIQFLNDFATFDKQRVLEIGSGDGRLTWKFARKVDRLYGIDLEYQDLRIASIETPAGLQEQVTFLRADSISLPFSSNTFQIALLSWLL